MLRDPEFPFVLGDHGFQTDEDRRREIKSRVEKAREQLRSPNAVKSGYSPRKATLAEWVVEIGDLYLRSTEPQS